MLHNNYIQGLNENEKMIDCVGKNCLEKCIIFRDAGYNYIYSYNLILRLLHMSFLQT